MDKHVSEQYENMLKRTEAATNGYIRELPEDQRVVAETIKEMYKYELEVFFEVFIKA